MIPAYDSATGFGYPLHGPFANWSDEWRGPASAEALRRALMTTDPVILHSDTNQASAAVTVEDPLHGGAPGPSFDSPPTACRQSLR
ncbi:hypothetical protein [Streptomyces sp. IBSBF 2806]|uniref:hypothetical protein n=1 Tax=Streptomyces sp. IBSBF 2806 TaxID=2903529 RepID=UPI002FDC2D44